MSNRARMRCRVAGCSELVRGKYCQKHLHDNARSNQETDPCYLTSEWRKFTKWIQMKNCICQRINNGVRCMNPSTLTHHLISPKIAPSRLCDPTNVCALCAGCHPKTDTPFWREDKDFVPTVYSLSI
jgi:hypothetical protein